MLDHRNEAYR